MIDIGYGKMMTYGKWNAIIGNYGRLGNVLVG